MKIWADFDKTEYEIDLTKWRKGWGDLVDLTNEPEESEGWSVTQLVELVADIVTAPKSKFISIDNNEKRIMLMVLLERPRQQ